MQVNSEIVVEPNGCALDKRQVRLGQRINDRRREIGISQAELARRAGLGQSTMNSLINGDSRSSRKIVQIARELLTTPSYLMGHTDDPNEGAPPPPSEPRLQLVSMPVALPSAAALERMFLGLLRPFALSSEADLARTLARQLPKGLARAQGPLIEEVVEDERELEAAEAHPNDHPAPRRATRT